LDQGADVLIPAGGLLMLLLSRKVPLTIDGAPEMNGINVLVKMAEITVRLKRIDGLSYSIELVFNSPNPS
jgi:allantoin racemase